MSVVETRLASLIEQMPKEGYKAAVVQGVVERIREIVDAALNASKLIECLGQAKGACKESFCNPACARIYMIRDGDRVRIGKFMSNPIGIEIEPGLVVFTTRNARLEVRSDGVVRAKLLGLDETVRLSDVDEVFKHSYLIKRVVREVGRRTDIIVQDLRACAMRMALVC
ncbi:MAG: hypothetical protein F7C34_03120 [Desulfurococcales archaeon]|nr:hypothetical protein [Desulfurococcales archaeon]